MSSRLPAPVGARPLFPPAGRHPAKRVGVGTVRRVVMAAGARGSGHVSTRALASVGPRSLVSACRAAAGRPRVRETENPAQSLWPAWLS